MLFLQDKVRYLYLLANDCYIGETDPCIHVQFVDFLKGTILADELIRLLDCMVHGNMIETHNRSLWPTKNEPGIADLVDPGLDVFDFVRHPERFLSFTSLMFQRPLWSSERNVFVLIRF